MKPIIYLDLLFLLNFLMDSIIIYSASLILKRRLHPLHLALAASVAALYSSAMFFPQLSVLYSLSAKVFFWGLIAVIAFPTKSVLIFFKNSLILCAVSAIFAGISFMLIFATSFGTSVGAAVSNGEIYININASTLTISTILAYSTFYVMSFTNKKNTTREKQIFSAKIFFFNNSLSIRALLDTGCELTDPLCGKAVLILDKTLSKKLLPTVFFNALEYEFIDDLPYDLVKRYRILPYSTINNLKGSMHAFVADKLILDDKIIPSAIIGLSPNKLCDNYEFDAIFNPEILTENKEEKNYAIQTTLKN